MKSQYPCVIKDRITGKYIPKGWKHGRHNTVWVSDLKKAKAYRNSSGAKNALRCAFGRFYTGPKLDIEVVEFYEEFRKEMERKK
jgi:hypothetical protein